MKGATTRRDVRMTSVAGETAERRSAERSSAAADLPLNVRIN